MEEKEIAPSKLGMIVTDIILNREAGWSGKLEGAISSFLEAEKDRYVELGNELKKPICRCMCEENKQAMNFNAAIDAYQQKIKSNPTP